MKTGTEYRQQVVGEVQKCVCRERYERYGEVDDNFTNIGELWTWWLKKRGLLADDSPGLTVLDVAQMNSMIKISRKVNNIEYIDNWIDDAGYNVCGGSSIAQKEDVAATELKVKAKAKAKSRAKNKAKAEAEATLTRSEAEAAEPDDTLSELRGPTQVYGDDDAEREPEHAGQGGEPAEGCWRDGSRKPSLPRNA